MRDVNGTLIDFRKYEPRYLDGINWIHRIHDKDKPLRFVFSNIDDFILPVDLFEHDFASIPRAVWPIVGPPTGDGEGAVYGPAAVIHDWCYQYQVTHYGRALTRRNADDIFRKCCFDLNVEECRIDIMYAAIRMGGWLYWNRHKREREEKRDDSKVV